jgi:hypothetical protein
MIDTIRIDMIRKIYIRNNCNEDVEFKRFTNLKKAKVVHNLNYINYDVSKIKCERLSIETHCAIKNRQYYSLMMDISDKVTKTTFKDRCIYIVEYIYLSRYDEKKHRDDYEKHFAMMKEYLKDRGYDLKILYKYYEKYMK